MPTKQKRNAELVANLKPDFTTRPEFYHAPARLNDALYWPTRFAGGARKWAWQATSADIMTSVGDKVLTVVNIGSADYGATDHGGPWVDLDGASEYMWSADDWWQEAGADTFFVWTWVQLSAIVGQYTVVAKYETATNERSWMLDYSNAVPGFRWTCNAVGAAVNNVVLSSTYGASVVGTWYFVGAYFQPSTLMRIFVGASTDTSLTIDSLGVAVPASCVNLTAPFTIGVDGGFGSFWPGKLSNIAGWSNMPVTYIDSHALTLFHNTRWFYQ